MPSQKPKALDDGEFADNDGHINGGLRNHDSWDSDGERAQY